MFSGGHEVNAVDGWHLLPFSQCYGDPEFYRINEEIPRFLEIVPLRHATWQGRNDCHHAADILVVLILCRLEYFLYLVFEADIFHFPFTSLK